MKDKGLLDRLLIISCTVLLIAAVIALWVHHLPAPVIHSQPPGSSVK